MPIRKRKPTSAGRRFQTSSDFSEVTKKKPEKSAKTKSAGNTPLLIAGGGAGALLLV